MKQRRKPAKHQPIPELAKALALPPEKRCRKTNKMATRGWGWAMGSRYIVYSDHGHPILKPARTQAFSGEGRPAHVFLNALQESNPPNRENQCFSG